MTTTSSYLSSDRVNLLDLKEWLRREFLSFFEDCNGKKLIIWDKQLTQPLGLIADYKVLKERGVDKMMDLRELKDTRVLKKKDVHDISHIFFIVKPKLDLMDFIAENVRSIESELKNEIKEFHILFVPRKTHLCEKKLKELGVYGSFKNNLKEFFLDLIPLDYDLLSMESPELFKDSFLYNDMTHLYHVAKSIMTMQSLYGIIPNVYGKGKYSKLVAEQIFRMRREMAQNQEPQIIPKIDNLILIDRTVDFITPMMTQLTYEGLIDENFGIKYTQLEIPQDRVKKQNQDDKLNVVEMKKSIVILNSADSLYGEIRDRNFNAINPVLSRTAKELQQANEVNKKYLSFILSNLRFHSSCKTVQINIFKPPIFFKNKPDISRWILNILSKINSHLS
ncbi:unnamed protein product [Brachionus calyciflorus]|uniref:Uncharacterized protein n=1 Tax=Brachionus calyciflorus TaxID=104777 RepID=A0A814FSG1_9BILA|nr:unnamed protein product [Brachionus calyciflorus]